MITKKTPTQTGLDKAIELVVEQMTDASPDELTKLADQVAKLYKLKEIDSPWRVSPDTLILVAGNLVGILLILNYERLNIVTSKAIGFVMKLK